MAQMGRAAAGMAGVTAILGPAADVVHEVGNTWRKLPEEFRNEIWHRAEQQTKKYWKDWTQSTPTATPTPRPSPSAGGIVIQPQTLNWDTAMIPEGRGWNQVRAEHLFLQPPPQKKKAAPPAIKQLTNSEVSKFVKVQNGKTLIYAPSKPKQHMFSPKQYTAATMEGNTTTTQKTVSSFSTPPTQSIIPSRARRPNRYTWVPYKEYIKRSRKPSYKGIKTPKHKSILKTTTPKRKKKRLFFV